MGYTLGQFTTYLRLAGQRELRVWRRQIIGQAHAFGGGEGLKKLLDTLGRD